MEIGRIERWYKQFVGPQDLVFDIGANVGDYTEGLARVCKRVIAVEPQSKVFKELCARFQGDAKVHAMHCAMGSQLGWGVLKSPADDSHNKHAVGTLSDEFIARLGPKVFNLTNGWDRQETVSIATIDLMIEKFGRPGFIKIDVEGYEAEAVRGLSQRIPLSLEFHPAYLDPIEAALMELDELGYRRFNYDLFSDFRFVLPEWVEIGELLQNLWAIDKAVPCFGDLYAR